ncbi:MAG: hypothetical protein ACYSUB_19075 [Planctomycetota bacterium]
MYYIVALIVLIGIWIIISSTYHRKPRISESEINIALCESSKDVDNNVPFRLIKDADNVIRIKQDYSLDSNNNWIKTDEDWYVSVSGVSYRKDVVAWFIAGTSREIELIKEPMSDYPHAIAVYGKWKDSYGKSHNEQLGYIDDDNAREISLYMTRSKDYKISAKLAMMYLPTEHKNPGLRIIVGLFVSKSKIEK